MRQQRVFPECNVDTNLVSHILGAAVMHKSTCNEVVKAMNNSDIFSIGIIDADKRQATMDSGFQEYVENPKADGVSKHITMFIHRDTKRYMFTVKPAMDKFILDAAKEQNVDLKELGFATSLDGFKKQTKRVQASNDPGLRRLFALIEHNSEFRRFRNTLKYLNNTQYDSDPELAKRFFNGELGDDALQQFLLYGVIGTGPVDPALTD